MNGNMFVNYVKQGAKYGACVSLVIGVPTTMFLAGAADRRAANDNSIFGAGIICMGAGMLTCMCPIIGATSGSIFFVYKKYGVDNFLLRHKKIIFISTGSMAISKLMYDLGYGNKR